MKKKIVVLLSAIIFIFVFNTPSTIEASYQSEASIIFKNKSNQTTNESNNIPDGIVADTKPVDKVVGNVLPTTATNNYLILFTGALLITISMLVYLATNRKIKSN